MRGMRAGPQPGANKMTHRACTHPGELARRVMTTHPNPVNAD